MDHRIPLTFALLLASACGGDGPGATLPGPEADCHAAYADCMEPVGCVYEGPGSCPAAKACLDTSIACVAAIDPTPCMGAAEVCRDLSDGDCRWLLRMCVVLEENPIAIEFYVCALDRCASADCTEPTISSCQ